MRKEASAPEKTSLQKASLEEKTWLQKTGLRAALDRLQALYSAMVRVRMPRILGLALRNPRDSVCAVTLAIAIAAIVANGLYLQPRRHPAPIFAERPLPVAPSGAAPAAAVSPVQLQPRRTPPAENAARRETPPRDELAAKIDAVTKNDSVPLPRPRTQNANAAARADAAADAASPPWQIIALQRTLNRAGYGPVKVNGLLDDSTREGIARFESAHNLPITGQNTPRVRHALSAVTGQSLD